MGGPAQRHRPVARSISPTALIDRTVQTVSRYLSPVPRRTIRLARSLWLLSGLSTAVACQGELELPAQPSPTRINADNAGPGPTSARERPPTAQAPASSGAEAPWLGPSRFRCEAGGSALPKTSMRRLTRDELLHSMEALVGPAVMHSPEVEAASAQIPAESTGDLVHDFQNTHALEHATGILLTAEAVAAAVARDPAQRARLFGSCATSRNSPRSTRCRSIRPPMHPTGTRRTGAAGPAASSAIRT